MLAEKPPEVRTIYAPDGTPHHCAPTDAREILAGGLGYTAEPPKSPETSNLLTGEAIFDQSYVDVEKKETEREQQPEQQSKPDDTATDARTAVSGADKPDNPSSSDAGGQTGSGSRAKSRSRK